MREGPGSKKAYSGRVSELGGVLFFWLLGPPPPPLVRQVCKHPAFSVSPVVFQEKFRQISVIC